MNDTITNVCKIGQGHDCCRYLTMGGKGFECQKHSSLAKLLDQRVEDEDINARGDNCDGKTIEELNSSKDER